MIVYCGVLKNLSEEKRIEKTERQKMKAEKRYFGICVGINLFFSGPAPYIYHSITAPIYPIPAGR
jgi:hypothetical protein